jgi:5-methylcytosine-specific restriction endonuclease McrA
MGSKHLGSYKWKQQRLLVLRRDCYICAYCGEAANEVDHIQPRVLGGTDDLDNLVACCRRCNSSKGKRSEALFLGRQSTPPCLFFQYLPDSVKTSHRLTLHSPT